jgi:hypothetical protein
VAAAAAGQAGRAFVCVQHQLATPRLGLLDDHGHFSSLICRLNCTEERIRRWHIWDALRLLSRHPSALSRLPAEEPRAERPLRHILTASYCRSLCWTSSAPVAWLGGCRPSTVRAYASFIQNFTLFSFRSEVHLPSSLVHICLSGLQIDCIRDCRCCFSAPLSFSNISSHVSNLVMWALLLKCKVFLDYSLKLV